MDLIEASYNGHLDIVKELIAANANIYANNNRALRWASRGGYLDM